MKTLSSEDAGDSLNVIKLETSEGKVKAKADCNVCILKHDIKLTN